MDKSYWEKIAPNYNTEIFDVLLQDEQGIIKKEIRKVAKKNKTVLDIGCAIGKWLPLLSSQYKKVIALDISKKNLKIAQTEHAAFKNISYTQLNMSATQTNLISTEVVLCVNALLTPSIKKRNCFIANLSKSLKNKGTLILVVPSLESALLTSIIRQQWNPDKESVKYGEKSKLVLHYKNFLQGNIEIDQHLTKHFLKEELELLLTKAGFQLQKVEKIEYPWCTEFSTPLKWLKHPKPWDWLIVATKMPI